MSGDVLRRAAGLIRLNAEEADDGFPWRAEGSYVDTDPECALAVARAYLGADQ